MDLRVAKENGQRRTNRTADQPVRDPRQTLRSVLESRLLRQLSALSQDSQVTRWLAQPSSLPVWASLRVRRTPTWPIWPRLDLKTRSTLMIHKILQMKTKSLWLSSWWKACLPAKRQSRRASRWFQPFQHLKSKKRLEDRPSLRKSDWLN